MPTSSVALHRQHSSGRDARQAVPAAATSPPLPPLGRAPGQVAGRLADTRHPTSAHAGELTLPSPMARDGDSDHLSLPSPEPTMGTDRRLTVRFGDAILAAGHTAVPNLVLRYYAQLGISDGEMMFTLQVWSHWWTARDPHPSIQTIAARMGKKERQVQYYVQGLRDKGLLRVVDRFDPAQGGQLTSEYDYSPLIAAVVAHARDQGAVGANEEAAVVVRRARPPAQSQAAQTGVQNPALPPAHRDAKSCTPPGAPGCAPPPHSIAPKEDPFQEDKPALKRDIDSMPPTPAGTLEDHRGQEMTIPLRDQALKMEQRDQGTAPKIALRAGPASPAPPAPALEPEARLPVAPEPGQSKEGREDAIARALAEPIALLADELGDRAPAASSLRRACNLYHAAGVGLAVFLDRLAEAAERTRVHRDGITARRRDGAAANCMPYLFAVLENLPDRERVASPARPWRGRRSTPAEADRGDVSRYTVGPYGVCPSCLSLPCEDDCPLGATEDVGSNPVPLPGAARAV